MTLPIELVYEILEYLEYDDIFKICHYYKIAIYDDTVFWRKKIDNLNLSKEVIDDVILRVSAYQRNHISYKYQTLLYRSKIICDFKVLELLYQDISETLKEYLLEKFFNSSHLLLENQYGDYREIFDLNGISYQKILLNIEKLKTKERRIIEVSYIGMQSIKECFDPIPALRVDFMY